MDGLSFCMATLPLEPRVTFNAREADLVVHALVAHVHDVPTVGSCVAVLKDVFELGQVSAIAEPLRLRSSA